MKNKPIPYASPGDLLIRSSCDIGYPNDCWIDRGDIYLVLVGFKYTRNMESKAEGDIYNDIDSMLKDGLIKKYDGSKGRVIDF